MWDSWGGRAVAHPAAPDGRLQQSAAILPFPAERAGPPARPPSLSDEQRALLRALRRIAQGSALARRASATPACAQLWRDAGPVDGRSAQALFRTFTHALDRPLTVFGERAKDVSGDERWLLRLIEALLTQDDLTARGLIAFRFARGHRRAVLPAAIMVAICVAHLARST